FFLIAHSMEASVVPLLLYFEHRNYLPAVGLLWAVAGAVGYVWRRLAQHIHSPQLLGCAGAMLLVAVLGAATHTRAWVWQSYPTMLKQGLEHYPDSRWLRMALATEAMQSDPPEVDVALA